MRVPDVTPPIHCPMFVKLRAAPDAPFLCMIEVAVFASRALRSVQVDASTGQVLQLRSFSQSQSGSWQFAYREEVGLLAELSTSCIKSQLTVTDARAREAGVGGGNVVFTSPVHHQAATQPRWIDEHSIMVLCGRAGCVEELDIRSASGPKNVYALPSGSRATSYWADTSRVLLTQESSSRPNCRVSGFFRSLRAHVADVWDAQLWEAPAALTLTLTAQPRAQCRARSLFRTSLGEFESNRCHFFGGSLYVWDSQNNLKQYCM